MSTQQGIKHMADESDILSVTRDSTYLNYFKVVCRIQDDDGNEGEGTFLITKIINSESAIKRWVLFGYVSLTEGALRHVKDYVNNSLIEA